MTISPIKLVLQRIKSAGFAYDPFIHSSILSYEAGHLLRNSFYATITGSSEDEQTLKAGYLANARVELSDLVTQARIIAEMYGWNWDELVSTGEEKLSERIETYKKRGVRPNETLLAAMMQYRDVPFTSDTSRDNQATSRMARRIARDGD